MKTKDDIQNDINQIEARAANPSLFTHDEMKGMADQMVYLRQIKYYLETEPTEEFVQGEYNKLSERLQVISNGFPAWLERRTDKFSQSEKSWRTVYNKEMNVKNLNNQLDNLKLILS